MTVRLLKLLKKFLSNVDRMISYFVCATGYSPNAMVLLSFCVVHDLMTVCTQLPWGCMAFGVPLTHSTFSPFAGRNEIMFEHMIKVQK